MDTGEATTLVTSALARLGLEATALGPIGATLRRHAPDHVQSAPLPSIAIEPADLAGRSDLVLRSELGRGGMGIVSLVEQRSLGREVAVKTARAGDTDAAVALLREARILGALEHPNVVPVYALGVDRDGAPVLVMKRVEGVPWRTLLHDDEHEAIGALILGHGDRLRAHVEILVQVARALSFAHDRGIVHRDVKPENVMIGRFGEVYLLDWGVALWLGDRDREPAGIVGTPAYMAPEIVRGDPREVDARTDVFLLAGCLYEILTRSMPNAAATPLAALVASLTGERAPLPASAPRELREICDSGLALDRDARPASAEAFRGALARFLASREADVLIAEAATATARADRARDEHGIESPIVARALIETRFALTSALRIRPGDASIRGELDAALARVVERELALRDVGGAREHLAEISGPRRDLGDRIDRLARELADDRDRAEQALRLRAEHDVSRAWPRIAGAVTWVLVVLAAAAAFLPANWNRPASAGEMLVYGTGSAMIFAAVVLAMRRRFFANSAGRRIVAYVGLWGFGLALPLSALGVVRGDDAFDYAAFLIGELALAAVGVATILPELWPVLVYYPLAAAAAEVWPERASPILVAVLVANAAVGLRAIQLRAARTRSAEAPPT